MKHFLRVFLFYVFALWLVSSVYAGFRISGGISNMFIAGFVLSVLMGIAKPILKILFIPINVLTFGIANWFINVVIMYGVTFVFPDVLITPYDFPGLSYQGFMIPSWKFSYLWSLIITTVSVTTIAHILHTLSED